MNKGDIVVGRYRLEDKLGMGGMGTVWSAEHIQTGRSFALKIMHATVASSEDSRSRFLKEAKASARINHPNVIDVLDVGELPDGGLFMAMELLEGLALSDALRLEPALSLRELLVVMRDACSALAAAHAVGIIHRDVKPANIFLHRDKQTGYVRPKLLDFGVSKFSFLDESHTHTGSLLGSPRYMSPEQARSATQADQRSDVWSIGVILFEGLIGSYPHDGDSFSNLVVAIATTPPRSAQAAVPSVARGLTALIDDCLRPRDQRVPSCEVLGARLEHLLASVDLSDMPCARGKAKKTIARPDDFVVRAMEQRDTRASQLLGARVLDEPSTNPAPYALLTDSGDATSLIRDPSRMAPRPLEGPLPLPVQRGPSSILGPIPSRTMDAPAPVALTEAIASAHEQPAAPARPSRPGGAAAAQTLLSAPVERPRPPLPTPGGQDATLIHTRLPTAREVQAALTPAPPPGARSTIPMNGGLSAPPAPLAPPLAPPGADDPRSYVGAPRPVPTQLLQINPARNPGAPSAPLVAEPRDQLVESISTLNVVRYPPGVTPYSAPPPPNDVETTASRDRNRKTSWLLAVGGVAVMGSAFVVIFLMGRAQVEGAPSAAEARPLPVAASTAAPAPAAASSPEAQGETRPEVEEAPSASAQLADPAASASAPAPPSASAPAASSAAPSATPWAPPASGRPYPPPAGRVPPKKDCSKDPIGCLDPQLH